MEIKTQLEIREYIEKCLLGLNVTLNLKYGMVTGKLTRGMSQDSYRIWEGHIDIIFKLKQITKVKGDVIIIR